MSPYRKAVTVILAALAGFAMMASGASASASQNRVFSPEQATALSTFGMSKAQMGGVVIDSALTRDQAIGSDSIVPAAALKGHRLIKPYLVVLPLVYHGYDGKVHIGQMVIHRYMIAKVTAVFLTMWKTGFPVKSVIPASQFGYNDQLSMAANNSSGYRPELKGEHRKGSSFDTNPYTNPFDVTKYDPTRPIEPAGAHYDPFAKGALVMGGAVQRKFADLNLEWGGNWGNPKAVPSTDFYVEGYYDWQHAQLGFQEYYIFEAQLPAGFPS